MVASAAEKFTRASTRTLLDQACLIVGHDSDGAELLRLGENAIFVLASSPVVVRIGRTRDHWDDAVKEIAVARWLNASGVRAARAEPLEQPIEVDEHPVTFWRYIDGRGGQPCDIRMLGALLRTVHQLQPPSDFRLPDSNPLGRVQARIDYSQAPPRDREFLSDRLATLALELPQLSFPLSPSVVHGDAHVENLMVDGDGAVLIDFERAAWGQPEWDLSLTATEFLSAQFWTEDQYASFVESYGYDVTSWSGFGLLRQTHELKMTSWLMQNINESTSTRSEYELRMESIRSGRPGQPWTPF